MKLILEKEEMLEVLHSALSNGGLGDLYYSDVDINVSREDYQQAKENLKKRLKRLGKESIITIEDVWVEILRSGKHLEFTDDEETVSFNLNKAMSILDKEPVIKLILEFRDGQDDSISGYNFLQYCLYGELIYG
jgi:hypothetical protein